MPKLLQKVPVLEGNGEVITYDRDPDTYYYRELVPGERRYRSVRMEGVASLEEAKKKSIDYYTKFRAPVAQVFKSVKKRTKTSSIKTAVFDYLRFQKERVESKQIEQVTLDKRYIVLTVHFLNYIETKGIDKTIELKEDTFESYPLYRKSTTPVNLRNELNEINTFFTYLKTKRLIKPDVAALRMVPTVRVKKDDLLANPAIGPDDWRTIHTYVRKHYKDKPVSRPDHRSYYWRELFYTFIMTAKNSGLRPNEMQNLRWKDVELIDYGPKSTKDQTHRIAAELNVRKTKTSVPRQVPTSAGTYLLKWKEFQQNYNLERFKHPLYNLDSHVFGNFANECRPFDYSMFCRAWRECLHPLKLKGHWASDHHYTIYSMRSSFIEDHLMKGTPIAELAMMAGHDPKILMQHYNRLDIRRKTEQLTKLPIGEKKEVRKVIDLEFD